MKTITFQGRENNFYHLLKEHSILVEEQVKKGKATITGFTKEAIDIGDRFNISGNEYKVEEVVERRDHAGEFLDSEDKKDSFFKVEASFERLINLR